MTEIRPHILVIVNVYRPDLGGGVLFSDLCDGLVEKGYRVSVKCAYSYYPEWKNKSGKNGWNIEHTDEYGVQVQRHGLFIPDDPNRLSQRLVHEASFFLSLLRRIPKRHSCDLILVFCPLVGAVAYAAIAGKRSGAPVWLNVQDLSAQAAAAGGMTERGSSDKGLLERLQDLVFRSADIWSTISEPMRKALERIPGAPEPVYLVPNWLHSSLARHLDHQPRHHSPSSPVKLLYSGNIGGKQDLLRFCRSLSASKEPYTFRIQGEGGRASDVRSWILASEDPRFEMAPLSDEAALAKRLADTDWFVISEKQGAGSSFIPSKLIPGIASGTPILAVCDEESPLALEVRQHGLGKHITWSELDAGIRLETDPAKYGRMVDSCLERSTFYERERGIDRCVAMIETILTRK